MSLEDKPKPKQNTPSGSDGTNPKGGVASSSLSKKDIEDAIKILDQEKQKLDTEIKKERQDIANQPNDTFEKEPDEENIEDKQKESNEDSQDPTIGGDNSETQEKQELPNSTIQVSKDGSTEEKKNEKSTEKESKTDNKKVINEEDQETFDDKSNFVDPSETDSVGIADGSNYIDYTSTGNTTENVANRAEIARFRQKEDTNQGIQNRIRQEEQEKQEKEDSAKDEIFDKQWDDYQNGKRDTAPTRNEVSEEFTKNQLDKELGKRDDNINSNQYVNNDDLQSTDNQTESLQPNNEDNLLEGKDSSIPVANSSTNNNGSSNYADYAPTGDPKIDAANKASVDRLRQQQAEDEKRATQEKEENANSKVEDQQWKDYTDSNRDTTPTKESVAEQRTLDQEKKQSQFQNTPDISENTDSKSITNTESEPFGQKSDNLKNKVSSKENIKDTLVSDDNSKVGDRSKIGSRLNDAGNKLNVAKNIAQDPGGAAKQAAEDKLKEYAQKAAKEAAKRAAQAAARAAQAAGSVASSIASSIGGALAGISGFLIPFIIAVVLFIAIFSAILVDAYCTPRPVVRGIIEYALTGDEKNLIQAADGIPVAGGVAAKVGDAIATHSELYKNVFYNKGGICPDKSPDKCNPGTSGTSGGSISAEYGTPTGKITSSQCAKLKEYKSFIDKASADYGIPSPIIGAIMSRESDVGEGNVPKGCAGYGDSGAGHGLGQIDPTSGAWGSAGTKNMPLGTPTVVKDKNGQPFIWNECESGIRYVAYHVVELEKLYSKQIATAGPKGSKAWWIRLLAANNAGFSGAKNGDSSTTGKDYGTDTLNRAADVVKCLGEGTTPVPNQSAKVDNKDGIDKIVDQLAENTSDSRMNNLKATLINQVKDRLNRKDEDSLKPIGKEQNGNILTRILNGIDVEAATPGNFIYSDEDKTVIGLIDSGKIKDVIQIVSPSRDSLKTQIEKKVLEPNTLKGMISIVNSGKFDWIQISSAYRAGDNPTSGHGSGQKVDIDSVSYKGKVYIHQSANDGDSSAIEAFYELAKSAKDTSVLLWIISGGKIFDKISTDSYMTGTRIIRDDKSNPIYGAIHENHYDLRFDPSATVTAGKGLSGSTASANDCVCGGGNSSGSGNIGTATGPGTVSKGEVFTPEVRAFLDTIANWEAEGSDKLGLVSYNSGNYKPNVFDSTKYATSYPQIDSPGNGGRYQVLPVGDRTEANTFLKKKGLTEVVGFDAKNQDLFAVGRWYYRAVDTNKENGSIQELLTSNFERAVGIASAEWASAPVIGGYRHADTKQSKADLATYKSYYEKRLAVYKSSAFIESVHQTTELAQLKTDNNISQNILNGLLQGVYVNAAYGTKPASYSTIKSDTKYLAFLKEIADTRGYEQYKDAGGKNTEMETALAAMVSASGGKLEVGVTYRSYDTQVGTYFTSSGVTKPISKYWSSNLTPDELKEVKAEYLARGTVSAPPSYSQHSTGLAVDFSPIEDRFESTSGYTWLKVNATIYGFKESYPKGSNKGAGFEPWHWQFVGNDKYKLSTPLTSFQIGGATTASNSSSSSCACTQPSTPAPTTTPTPATDGKTVKLFNRLDFIPSLENTGSFGSVNVNAQSATTVAEKRKKLTQLFDAKYIGQGENPQVSDRSGYEKDFDDNMIQFMYDLYYNLGITWIGGPLDLTRSYGDHRTTGEGSAVDFWAFAKVSEVEGAKKPFGKMDGGYAPLPFLGPDPGSEGNKSDPRIKRHIDLFSSNGTIAQEATDIITKVAEAAVSTGTIRDNGVQQLFTTDKIAASLSAKYKGKTFQGHSTDLSQGLRQAPAPVGTTNGHHNHIHIGLAKASSVAYKGINGVTALAPCPTVSTTSNLGANSKAISKNPPANLIITDESGKVIKQINGSQPVTGASIFKVIIASVALKNNIDLNKQLTLSSDIWLPDEKTYTKNQTVAIGDLLKTMLNDSNNTAANALMKEVGGMDAAGGPNPRGFDAKAKVVGYSSVSFNRWFTANSNMPGMDSGGKRNASVEDTNKAFIDIFNNSGGGYDIAKEALKTNPHKFQGAQYVEAFKHGNTSSVLGISSKLSIEGKVYYVTMIYNIKTDGLLEGDPIYTFKLSNPITKFLNEIKSELK
ncbi:MAG: D-alanyl-D-alanine carboxypeptidase family protein [candidate division SR1 bacterium]|nr:D-alanyl-D-alanine carboxypeptidase family protein [candidate division SR1 bacterium]